MSSVVYLSPQKVAQELEVRYAISEDRWHSLLLRYALADKICYQSDKTWKVLEESNRLVIARIRWQGKSVSIIEKDMTLKNGHAVSSIETPFEGNFVRALELFSASYVKDKDINKFRAVKKIGPVKMCLDHVVGLGFFLELEINNPDFQDDLKALEEQLGLLGRERCRPYGYYLDDLSNRQVPVLNDD